MSRYQAAVEAGMREFQRQWPKLAPQDEAAEITVQAVTAAVFTELGRCETCGGMGFICRDVQADPSIKCGWSHPPCLDCEEYAAELREAGQRVWMCKAEVWEVTECRTHPDWIHLYDPISEYSPEHEGCEFVWILPASALAGGEE